MTLSAPEPTSNPAAATAADPRQDPAMRNLYRMSRTAGVGLQDYAAVNVFAVVGVLLALASVLVLIFADVTPMLLLPLGAIVVSVVAFIQVQRSSGTQTGRGIALAGIVIAGLLGGTNIYGRVAAASREGTDRAALSKLVQQFQDASLASRWSDAYALFDSRFHDTVKPETFERTLAPQIGQAGRAHVLSMKLGDRIVFETDANGVRLATTLLTLSVDRADGKPPFEADEPAEFRLVDDDWKIHNIINWFSTAAQPKAGSAAPR